MAATVLNQLDKKLAEQGLVIEAYQAAELPPHYINQLIGSSRQAHILEYEGHEDADGRFKDAAAYRQWAGSKNRYIYLLLDKSNIAGIIWFGQRPNRNIDKSYGLTFAIRLYQGYVGKGLSKPFMKAAHQNVLQYYGKQKIWLDFAADNIAAKKAYESFGYQFIKQRDGRIIMGLEPGNFNKPKSVVVIGGGHGSAVVLSALKDKNLATTGIVSMADDGGSTGRLRQELGVSAVGDIRNCLAALSGDREMADLFSYRFSAQKLDGHSLGNLFLAAGEIESGSLQDSIDNARQALSIDSKIFPVSLDKPNLVYSDGDKEITGVFAIASSKIGPKPDFSLRPSASLNPLARQAIDQADLVVIAPGNFYCSIIPCLLTDGLVEALGSSDTKVAIFINLVNSNQTPDFSVADYLAEIKRINGQDWLDFVVYNTALIDKKQLKTGESAVEFIDSQAASLSVEFIGHDLVDNKPLKQDPNDKIAKIRSLAAHNKKSVADIIYNILAV